MKSALMNQKENITTKPVNETSYIEIELDHETYAKLMYCQKKMNVSVDEIVKQSIYALKEDILK